MIDLLGRLAIIHDCAIKHIWATSNQELEGSYHRILRRVEDAVVSGDARAEKFLKVFGGWVKFNIT
jgi:hypothetical protein